MKRLVAIVIAGGLALSACSGSDEKSKSSLPLPDKAPSSRGPATGPPLEAKVLLAAADDLESTLGDDNRSGLDGRAGAFVSGKTAVGYSLDDISGYDVDSGEKLWTAKLDMRGGTVCSASQPDGPVKNFIVVFGENDSCRHIATIRVADGKVVAKKSFDQLSVDVGGESLSLTSIDRMWTVKRRDYLMTFDGDVLAAGPKPGALKRVATLETDSYSSIGATPDGKYLIGTRLEDGCKVDAYALPSFKHLWTKSNAELFPDVDSDCVISLAAGNPSWLAQEDDNRHFLVQVDPKTGAEIGRVEGEETEGPSPKGTFDVSAATLFLDTTVGLNDGDMIFVQPSGISRYSLAEEKFDWQLDLSQFELDSDDEFQSTTVLPQAMTKDGYLVATTSNATDVDLVAIEVSSGKLVGRWPLPDEYRNGFQVNPGVELFDGGVVFTRNFRAWQQEFDNAGDEPEGDRFDIGVFTFPDRNAAKKNAGAVPTAGPVDLEASWIGGVKHATVDEKDAYISAELVRKQLIVRQGEKIRALDTKSGKSRWTAHLPAGARSCTSSDLDNKSTALAVVYKTSDKSPCRSLVRIGLKKGTVGEVIAAPDGRDFSRVLTFKGRDFVIDDAGSVYRLNGQSVQPTGAKVKRRYTSWIRTPEDPTLIIASAVVGQGKDMVLDAYRLPSFEPVWSTTASKALGKVDKRNPVNHWSINGLYVSASFGDHNDPEAKINLAMTHLDAKTGKVSSSTGRVRQDYGRGDKEKFSLTHAGLSYAFGAAFADGSLLVEQDDTIMRYDLDRDKVMWKTDVASIRNTMEQLPSKRYTVEQYKVLAGGKSVLVVMSSDISVEFMAMNASSGKITGRWKAPSKYRNGLQTFPDAVPIPEGVAVIHSPYSWDSTYGPKSGTPAPKGQMYDVGLFGLKKAKK